MGDFPLKFADSGIKYRGYLIHKKVYESYLIFYIINSEKIGSLCFAYYQRFDELAEDIEWDKGIPFFKLQSINVVKIKPPSQD